MAVRLKKVYSDFEEQNLDYMLPTFAYQKGWTLFFEPPLEADPVILRDKRSGELYRWDYTPSLTEVLELCKKLEVEL